MPGLTEIVASPAVLALCAATFFGLALVLTQFGLRHLPPHRGAVVSIGTTALLFWILSPLALDLAGWDARAVAVFLAVGLLFPAAATLLTFEANRRMGPSVSGALGNLAPLFAVALAALAFGEAPDPLQTIGIATILIGVAALSVDRRWLDTSWPYWAAGLPIAAAAIRGFVQPVMKFGLALWPSPFAAVLAGYTISALVVAGAAARRIAAHSGARRWDGISWFAAVGICNGTAVLAMYAALARGPVVLVAPLVATYPLVTLALTAILWRGARTTLPRVVGVALTVIGIAVLIGG
jgi:drug/metabolite transporter (DMT)-like permease